MDDKHLDTLFREKLSLHEVLPSPSGWSKLEQKLEQKKMPVWLLWGKYAAGFLLLLGLALSLRYWEQTLPDSGGKLVTETPNEQPSPQISPIPVQKDSLLQQNEVPKTQPIEKQNKRSSPPPTPIIVPREQVASLPETRVEDSIPIPDNREMERTDLAALEPVILPDDFDVIIPEVRGESNEIAYTVKVVSRGYAIAPDKTQLVEGLENKLEKIGGFFTRVDKGFGDLQDAKNDLFTQVMASKKDK